MSNYLEENATKKYQELISNLIDLCSRQEKQLNIYKLKLAEIINIVNSEVRFEREGKIKNNESE